MGFYDLTREQRAQKVEQIHLNLLGYLKKASVEIFPYFSDEDTYIRKAAYQSVGKIFDQHEDLREQIISLLQRSLLGKNDHVRQTVINAAGEIGMKNFDVVVSFFDKGLFDNHHSVRNAVIGSIKKMGEKNPVPVLQWSKKYLHHPDKEIRREICHGIELRGRTHPEDILPLLKELQNDPTPRVRNTLIHVIGQISYKKDCLSKVIGNLKRWENKDLVTKAVEEIIDVHERYKDFAVLSQEDARKYIENHL
jgi:HEAT repeat protein